MKDLHEIIDRLSSLETRVSAFERLSQGKPSQSKSGKKISIKEFLFAKNPQNDVQKTLTIAYFLENHTDLTSFNVEDLTHSFRAAKEPVPLNVSDKINMNIRKGHIMEAGEKKSGKKAFTLTNSGETFVERNFK